MRIVELTAFHVKIPFKKTIRHASHSRDSTDSIVIRCRLDNLVVGWGEGLPRPYVTGESIETVFDQFQNTDWVRLLGASFSNLQEAVAVCQDWSFPAPPSDKRDCFGNSLRCAIELSLLDAAAQSEQLPLSKVAEFVPECAAVRHTAERVQYSAAITAMSPFREVVRAQLIRWYGFHQVKTKVGVNGFDEADSLRRIRKIVGPRIDIRIDANEAWTCETIERRLAKLTPFQISAVEQPVGHEFVDGLAAVRQRIETPLMLDESLCSLHDALRAVEQGTCDLFNIRLSKCGGFINSLKLAAIANRAGLGYQLGCQVGETGILSAAGRHFATSVADIRYLEGSFDHHLVKERLTREDITFGRGGMAPALAGPGLGVQVDVSAVARVTVNQAVCKFC